MLPSRHIIVSLPLGAAVGFFTQFALAGILCFFSGVLIDADHIIEYVIHYGLRNFNFKEMYQSCAKMANREEEGGVKKLFLVFHWGEIAILLWMGFIFTKNIYILSIAIGYTGHIILDVAANNALKPSTYFISTRIKNGFRTADLIKNR